VAFPSIKSTRNAIFLVVSVGAILLYLLWSSSAVEPSAEAVREGAGWKQPGVANPFAPGAVSASAQAFASIALESVPLSVSGTSLAGTQADGDWGVNSQGQLQASRTLRQRFDYYLSLIGEMPLASIESLLQQDAKKSLKEPALSQVLSVWRNYVKLQQHAWQHAVDLKNPATWSTALAERQTVRRQILGADWAYAFYAEDERELQAMLSQVNSPTRAVQPNPEPPTAALHPQASEREAALKAEWLLWDQRVQAAREQVSKLKVAAELSEPQRQQAIQSYLSQQFHGADLIRARALLGI
jgi:lipase chaperone LimK